MLFLLFGGAGLVLLGLILLADFVKNRVVHTPQSRRALLLVALGSLGAGLAAVEIASPFREPALRLALAAAIALPLYLLTAGCLVFAWSRRKQGRFDREIVRLTRERNNYQELIDRLVWQEADLRRKATALEQECAARRARLRSTLDQVEGWEEGGEGERFERKAQLRQWRQEYGHLDAPALREVIRGLQGREGTASDPPRLGALLGLLEAMAQERELRQPGAELKRVQERLRNLALARARGEERLERVRAELRDWTQKKSEFRREKIPLD